jgi:predicted GIY-YIG superfamily endonuclease
MAKMRDHHSVYVIELKPGSLRGKSANEPALYVGMTGLAIEQRFENHRAGYKSSGVVKRFGSHLRPDLYEHLNPMTWQAAATMEKQLASELRRSGAEVFGGH